MKYQIKLTVNKQRISSGYAVLRFYVSGYGQHDYIPTGIKWKFESFNEDDGIILRGDASLKEYTLALSKVSDLQKKITTILDNQTESGFSIAALKLKLKGKEIGKDFITYATNKALERLQNKEIAFSTYTTQIDSINVIKEFSPVLLFSKINLTWLESYKTFLINVKGYERNTLWARLKDLRTYFNQARKKDKIDFDYPFGSEFKMPKTESRIEFLYENEFQAIKNHYLGNEILDSEKRVLRAFLFACYTSLRIGDITSIRGKHIKNNILEFSPNKSLESETKQIKKLRIPLHDFSKVLIGQTPKEKLIFYDLPSEQKVNERLKSIAKKLDIPKEITFHYSRHTFATRFLAAGGAIEILQEIMGHEDIKTTMVYIHVEPSRKAKQINMLT